MTPRTWKIALSFTAVLVTANPTLGQPVTLTQAEVGAAPRWNDAVQIGEQMMKSQLVDPDSAKFEWPYNFTAGSLKSFFGKARSGYYTCGQFNSKNRMGGYTGRQWFLMMLKDGQVTELQMDSPDSFSLAEAACQKLIEDGNVTPVATPPPTIPAVATPTDPEKPVIGINYAALPDGAYISVVKPGSAADAAGLKQGMVVGAINGIALKGMPLAAMQAVFGGVDGDITLTVIGVGEVHLRKAKMPAK